MTTKTLKQQLQEQFDDILLRLFANVINIATAKKELLALGKEWLTQKRQETNKRQIGTYTADIILKELLEELQK